MVLADVFKRFADLRRYPNTALLTGTDEHGLKVQKAAQKAGLDTQTFCDQNMARFKQLADKAGIGYSRFIRTTDSDHKSTVEHVWRELNQRGYIYESEHEGWYSVSDETFFPESAVALIRDPSSGRKLMASIETGNEVEWTSETNYHFKLSAFRERLLEHYAQHPRMIQPKPRLNQVINEVTAGLSDLSISRPTARLNWGIRVPNDDHQTIYVWLDALVNYLTQAGYPFAEGSGEKNGWPPYVQVIGKDITRFHAIYWPAFLMALNLQPPRRILTHAHWTMNHAKMSKSAGNAVNPFFAIDRFGVDTMRFYMVLDGGIVDDAPYDNAFIINRHKTILQNVVGNLLSRITRTKRWSVRTCIQQVRSQDLQAKSDRIAHHSELVRLRAHVKHCFVNMNPRDALYQILDNLRYVSQQCVCFCFCLVFGFCQRCLTPFSSGSRMQTNKFMSDHEVWRKIDDPSEAVQQKASLVIYYAAESLRICGILLQPFMPGRMKELLDTLGVRDDKRTYLDAAPGADFEYGQPRHDIKPGSDNWLFPPLHAIT